MLQQTILYVLTFLSGLFFGSFFNLVSDRVVKGKSILLGRSECDHCGNKLLPKNLIPLFSYILQKGKCSFCGQKLSLFYPISEIATGFLFVGVVFLSGIFLPYDETLDYYAFFKSIAFIYLLGVASFYLILTLTDLKYRLIPDKIIYPAIYFVLAFVLFTPIIRGVLIYNALKMDAMGKYMLEAGYMTTNYIFPMIQGTIVLLVSAAALALFFVFLILITKGKGMGGGDVKLAFLIGLVNTFPINIIAIFLGFVFGSVISLVMILFKRKTMKDSIAFGPFMILGSVVALLWGDLIFAWYTGLL